MSATPEQVHHAEQDWAMAQDIVNRMLNAIRTDIPFVERVAGTSDSSAVFDYTVSMLVRFNVKHPGRLAILCAAALTRLVQLDAPAPGDDLVRFEKEMEKPQ